MVSSDGFGWEVLDFTVDIHVLSEVTGRKEDTMDAPTTKYKLCLCRACIADLDSYYPYIILRSQLEITEVSDEDCDNTNLDDYNERLRRRNPDFF